MTIQLKAIEQYFHVLLFKLDGSNMPVDMTILCDHSIESYWAVRFFNDVQGG